MQSNYLQLSDLSMYKNIPTYSMKFLYPVNVLWASYVIIHDLLIWKCLATLKYIFVKATCKTLPVLETDSRANELSCIKEYQMKQVINLVNKSVAFCLVSFHCLPGDFLTVFPMFCESGQNLFSSTMNLVKNILKLHS